MIETIQFKGESYPKFQAEGFAAKFAIPYAQQVCKGRGLDIGCGRREWIFPGARPIDPATIPDAGKHHALDLPSPEALEAVPAGWDYIFSSHCLEHIPNWVDVLDYWFTKIHDGGVIFLYLPDFSQLYWRPWENRKHIHSFTPKLIEAYLLSKSEKVFVSGVDLNNSFMAMAEK